MLCKLRFGGSSSFIHDLLLLLYVFTGIVVLYAIVVVFFLELFSPSKNNCCSPDLNGSALSQLYTLDGFGRVLLTRLLYIYIYNLLFFSSNLKRFE